MKLKGQNRDAPHPHHRKRKVVPGNLKKVSKNREWLKKELKKRGGKQVKEIVYLAVDEKDQ
jgi:uncharacterized membrane protein YcaP (DUF421 family)